MVNGKPISHLETYRILRRDLRITKMEENNIYAAGLLDGEGTITMCLSGSKNRSRYPVVSISSTTIELLTFLKENYGGVICFHKKYKEHHNNAYSWKLVYNNAINFLYCILPYIKEPEKIRRAKLIIEKYKILTKRNGKYSITEQEAKNNFMKEFFHNTPDIQNKNMDEEIVHSNMKILGTSVPPGPQRSSNKLKNDLNKRGRNYK
jgi:hypothetical protein